MIMKLDLTNETAFLPPRSKIDDSFATGWNMAVEDSVLDLAIAEYHFHAVELDVVAADKKLYPLEASIVAADADRVVIVNEPDMAIPEPHPLAREGCAS